MICKTENSAEALQLELRDYYQALRVDADGLPVENWEIRQIIVNSLKSYDEAHPDLHPSLLKARQMEVMARYFQPKVFRHSPFFHEMGLRPSENWGIPGYSDGRGHMGSWMFNRLYDQFYNSEEFRSVLHWCVCKGPQGEFQDSPYWNANGLGFDSDHHCLGYTQLLKEGISGLLARIRNRKKQPMSSDQLSELDAMERGLHAVIGIANRFADEAQALLIDETDPVVRSNLSRIAESARHIPENSPRTFYEGLAFLWFLREVTATLESIGISVVGHPDRQLIGLYRDDLSAGRLTESEAEEMIALWMIPTDVKTFTREREWPETSTCIMLGGCDENGGIVWNELTRLFLRTHRKYNLINPKLNCRYGSESPREYLELMAEQVLAGHNHFAFLNDDLLIAANMRYGKSEKDARLYVNGGCQETMCEGVEHTAGAYFYYNMVAVLSDWFSGQHTIRDDAPVLALQAIPPTFTFPDTFEEFYRNLLDALAKPLRVSLDWMNSIGEQHWKVNPCPVFSATLEDCIENGTDYTKGGAKYNLSGITLIGLGNVVNMLNVVRVGVYEEKWTTLEELRNALRTNWENAESLRRQALSLALFGHGVNPVDQLADRFMKDMAALCRSCRNERGGNFQPSFFVYYMFQALGERTRATPDGRRNGDIFCQGVAPDRRHAPQSLTEVFQTIRSLDFADYPGNSVLDVQLPSGGTITPKILAAVLDTFARVNGSTLQLNCVDSEDLKDAQRHPENYENLTVRISGLSACFVRLKKNVQNEIISRTMYCE